MKKLLVVLVVALTILVSCSEEDKTLKMLNSELKGEDYTLEEGFKISSYTLEEVPTKDEIKFEMIDFYKKQLKEYKTIRGWSKLKGYKESKRKLDSLNAELEEHPITLRYTIKVLENDGRNVTRVLSFRK